jgi:hypothetical protein
LLVVGRGSDLAEGGVTVVSFLFVWLGEFEFDMGGVSVGFDIVELIFS